MGGWTDSHHYHSPSRENSSVVLSDEEESSAMVDDESPLTPTAATINECINTVCDEFDETSSNAATEIMNNTTTRTHPNDVVAEDELRDTISQEEQADRVDTNGDTANEQMDSSLGCTSNAQIEEGDQQVVVVDVVCTREHDTAKFLAEEADTSVGDTSHSDRECNGIGSNNSGNEDTQDNGSHKMSSEVDHVTLMERNENTTVRDDGARETTTPKDDTSIERIDSILPIREREEEYNELSASDERVGGESSNELKDVIVSSNNGKDALPETADGTTRQSQTLYLSKDALVVDEKDDTEQCMAVQNLGEVAAVPVKQNGEIGADNDGDTAEYSKDDDAGKHVSDKQNGNDEDNAYDDEVSESVSIEVDEDDFVAVELVRPTHASEAAEGENYGLHSADTATTSQPEETAIPLESTDTTNDPLHDNNATAYVPINSTIHSLNLPRRKKILHHPFITPLTKLPWDRFISAAGACDVLFNCKYSMRQVEDEVLEEKKRLGNGEEEAAAALGRDDGYVNLSLGNECNEYNHFGEERCDENEFVEMGLECCSVLDDEEEDEAEGEKVDPKQSTELGNTTTL